MPGEVFGSSCNVLQELSKSYSLLFKCFDLVCKPGKLPVNRLLTDYWLPASEV